MTAPAPLLASKAALAEALAAHFIMWRDLGGPDEPPGEWFCSCGKKFGFSDTAIEHQADELSRVVVPVEELAEDEALVQAIAPYIYEAYRLGKYGAQEYLPMWHEPGDHHNPMPEARQAAQARRERARAAAARLRTA